MFPPKRSLLTFLGLVFLLALLTAANIYLPQGEMGDLMKQTSPVTIPQWQLALGGAGMTLVMYGLLGFLGLVVSRKVGVPDIWSPDVDNRKRFLLPAIWGGVIGIVLIVGDYFFSKINGIGHFVHPPFPTSIVASISAGIGEELIFRLFFISFWTWLIGFVILRGKGLPVVFAIFSVLSALAFGAGHLPSLMIITGAKTFADFSPVLLVEIFLLNGILGLGAAYFFKKAGYLAAIGIHFWADIVWHVLFGLI